MLCSNFVTTVSSFPWLRQELASSQANVRSEHCRAPYCAPVVRQIISTVNHCFCSNFGEMVHAAIGRHNRIVAVYMKH